LFALNLAYTAKVCYYIRIMSTYVEGLNPDAAAWRDNYDVLMTRGQEEFANGAYADASALFGFAGVMVDANDLLLGDTYKYQSQALERIGETTAAEVAAARALDLHTQEEWQKYTKIESKDVETTRAHLGGVVLRNALRSTLATGRLDKPGIFVAGRHLSVAVPRLLALHERGEITNDTLQEGLIDNAQLNIFTDSVEAARTQAAQAAHLVSRGELQEGAEVSAAELLDIARHYRTHAGRRALNTNAIALRLMRSGHLPQNKTVTAARMALVGYPRDAR
jgi:tetratricopeptide (TPR) repeat protein